MKKKVKAMREELLVKKFKNSEINEANEIEMINE